MPCFCRCPWYRVLWWEARRIRHGLRTYYAQEWRGRLTPSWVERLQEFVMLLSMYVRLSGKSNVHYRIAS